MGLRRSFAWQAGYGAFTVSESRRESVLAYIRDQERHPTRATFRDELARLLAKHGLSPEEVDG